MSRKTKKFIVGTLIIATLGTLVTGCGSSDKSTDNNTVATTTKREVTTKEPTTTAEPTTTVPPTTEEPSTEYVMKGRKVFVLSEKKDIFMDLTVESGYSISINDIYPEGEEYNSSRSVCAKSLAIALLYEHYIDEYNEFIDQYTEPGDGSISINYEDNAVIEYNGSEKYYFHFLEEKDGKAYFDVYEVK